MSKCLGHLDKCMAGCCRFFVFNVEMTEDLENYYNLHEGIIAKDGKIFVMNKCKALGDDCKCKLYGKKERPKICSQGYTKQKEGVFFPENCIYNKDLNKDSA